MVLRLSQAPQITEYSLIDDLFDLLRRVKVGHIRHWHALKHGLDAG